MILGIIKNNEKIIGECRIDYVIVSHNKFKTIICNNIPATSKDFIIFKCCVCDEEKIANKRIFCDKKHYTCLCQKCSMVKTSTERYGVPSPNQSAKIKEKQQRKRKKIGTIYVDGNSYKPRITQSSEELSRLRSVNAKNNWSQGKYDHIDNSLKGKKIWENPEFREKTIKRLRSTENRQRQSELAKARWLDPNYRSTVPNKISNAILSNPEEINRRKAFAKKKWNNDYDGQLKNLLENIPNQLSKLHRKIASELKLKDMGFISEQRVGRYLVDEINSQLNIIIEINGDYIHANPKIYQSTDIIKLPGNSYTAGEKWESDKIKINNLKNMGFKVFVIWESDNLVSISGELKKMLST